ncbi:MAG: hypothetical protein CL582_14275 [Alteromonadaceae bacterium]|nr:hypothetical protein [Alteromonadaceae bacterium]|tara:strand:- start:408 stop:1124 length:717 start_codon:yes stop_codon:yes gene_type:complete
MNLDAYKRDASKVQAYLKELKDGSVITTKGCKIYIPTRFRDKSLATIGKETYILGLFMIAVEDKYYAVNNVNAMMRIEPSSINTVSIENKDYFEFVFEQNDTVFPSTDLVKDDTLLYYIFDEVVSKGNIPAYMNYLDLGHLFDTAQQFAGVKLVSTPTVMHMLLSKLARDPGDLNTYFRQVSNGDDLDNARFLQLRSNTHGATNTTARLMGSYFSDNITSALVNPAEREENIERILRS